MKRIVKRKWLGAGAMLLALSLTLGGCYVTPDVQTSGNNGNWPEPPTSNPNSVYTTAPSDIPTNAPTPTNLGGTVTLNPDLTGMTGTWNGVVGSNTQVPQVTRPPVGDPSPSPTPQGSLKKGSKGQDVKEVQQKLKDLGFLKGSVDGTFGDATEAAVMAFQQQYGLEVDGKVGPATRAKLASARQTARPTVSPTPQGSMKKGSEGNDVRAVQQKLKDLGFLKGSVDGSFGDATEEAVRAFQRQYGLEVDGKVGTETLAALNSARRTAKPAATSTPRPTATPSYSDNTYLRLGNSGSKVKQLQQRLISLGYLIGTADGDYDAATEAAVYAFQDKHCSYSDGVAGPDTLNALYSNSAKKASSASGIVGLSLRIGDEGAAVRTLQNRLKKLGYYKGNVDGTFGVGTEDAVKAFQQAYGLKADGVAGGGTYDKLFAQDAKTASQAARTNTPRPAVPPRRTPTPLPSGTYVDVTTAPSYMDYATLRRGYRGAPVTRLQQALKDAGYYTGAVDGYYGESTESAVRAYQRVKGLAADGVAGPATLTALYVGAFPPES